MTSATTTRIDLGCQPVAAAQAPAYEERFRASVQEALDDPRPVVPSATVERHFARRRAAAKRKAAKRAR
ncbi:MAG: hypothetical protein ACREU6_12475 [Steroidobacteraceae bacterium]